MPQMIVMKKYVSELKAAFPWKVFEYVYRRNFHAEFNFMCVINSEKWQTLKNRDELFEMKKNNPALKIQDVKIKNPDNPAKLNDAKLITYEIF